MYLVKGLLQKNPGYVVCVNEHLDQSDLVVVIVLR